MMQDWQLLREYVDKDSQAAFTLLVERHVNLVYATCLRELGDPALAEDVTQVVFLILARKAATLREGTVIAGWLFNTARFASKDARKQEVRRQRREQKAVAEMIGEARVKDATWADLEPLLHDGLARLGGDERNALLLRFFEDKSLKETGVALGITQAAAQKRVERALDKLRRYFARHGYVVTTALVATILADNAVQAAPVTCVALVTKLASCVHAGHVVSGVGHIAAGSVSSMAGGSASTGSLTAGSLSAGGTVAELMSVKVMSLSQGVLKAMFISQVKVGAIACAGLTLGGTGAGAIVKLALAEARPALHHSAKKVENRNEKRVAANSLQATMKKRTHKSKLINWQAPQLEPLQSIDSPVAHPRTAGPPMQAALTGPSIQKVSSPIMGKRLAQVAAPEQALTINEPESKPEWLTMQPGEIQVQGSIRSVDQEARHIILEVTSFALPGRAVSELATPKPKTILISEKTSIHVRGDAQQKVKLTDLTNLGDGVFALAVGQDMGTGRNLPAREIAVWDRIEAGRYRFKNMQAIGQENTLDTSLERNPVPRVVNQTGTTIKSFDFLSTPAPGQWFDKNPIILEPRHRQALIIDGQSGVRLLSDDAKTPVVMQRRFKLPPGWESLYLRARVRTKLQAVQPDRSLLGTVPAGGAYLQVGFEEEDHNEFARLPLSGVLKGEQDWTTLQTQGAIPAGAVYVRVKLIVHYATGTADFMNITIEGVPASIAAAPAPIAGAAGPVRTIDAHQTRDDKFEETFEVLNNAKKPVGWNLPDAIRTLIVEEEGNHFLRLRSDRTPSFVNSSIRIALDPAWKRLRLIGKMRAINLRAGPDLHESARVSTMFQDALGNKTGAWPPGLELRKDTDWMELVTELNIPKGARYIQLGPQTINTIGEVDFDDIKLLPVPALDPLPIRPGMPEGTFEQVDNVGTPAGWSLINHKHISVAEENGNRFLRLHNTEQPMLRANGAFKIDPTWKKLKLKVRMRARKLESARMGWEAAHLAYDFIDAKDNNIGPMQTMPAVKADTDWITHEVEITVPPGAVTILLKPEMIHKFGTVDFDDILLTPSVIEPAP